MAAPNAIPALPVAVPLLTAATLGALRKWLPRPLIDATAIGAAAATLCLSVLLLRLAEQHTLVYWFGNWYPRGHMVLGITFLVDPAGAGLASLAALLTTLALLFSWRQQDAADNHYQPLMLIFLAAMCGFALTGDLFNMFVFFELMSTAAFALCGLKTLEPAPLQGAFNFAITNTIAAFMVLTGIALLYATTGALNLAQIGATLGTRHDPLVLFACTLLTSGFLIKGAIAPFHFWLADAHAVAPTPVCVLFSGIMVELGLYAVLRLHITLFQGTFSGAHAARLRAILFAFGLLTAILGGLMCYAEHHAKRLLAFSTISHSGLMLLAIATGTPVAIAGFFTYLLAHALIKSALFFLSGILLHRLRTISEPLLFGRGRPLRYTGLLWLLASLGLAGAPLFLTMHGESLVSHAAEGLGQAWVPYAFLLAGALTAAAALRFGMRTFCGWGQGGISDAAADVGELPETSESDATICWYQVVPPTLCLAAAIACCLLPRLPTQILDAALRLHDQPGYIQTVYTGTAAAATPLAAADLSHRAAALHGSLAGVLALLLASTSVFRQRLPRALRLGAFLEGPLPWLRNLQSGHPGDYVTWIVVGAATLGCCLLFLT
ncbi:MAG TPA: complex I subunit 5 family protein [Acidobacteriaceae bacterium]